VALVRTDVSEEDITSITRVARMGELTTSAVTSNRSMLAFPRSVLQFLVTTNVFPSSLILSAMMMEAIRSSETSICTRATWRNIPEYGILYKHRRETLNSYCAL
jgi:hypothetical protein